MQCPIISQKWLKRLVPVVLGMLGGYTYYALIGCLNGSCPITSNPWISTLYGGIIGALFIPSIAKRHNDNTTTSENNETQS